MTSVRDLNLSGRNEENTETIKDEIISKIYRYRVPKIKDFLPEQNNINVYYFSFILF